MSTGDLTFTFPLASLDHLANNIASATFDVINGGQIRTADMGGRCLRFA